MRRAPILVMLSALAAGGVTWAVLAGSGPVGGAGYVTKEIVGCTAHADALRIMTLVSQDDMVAAERFIRSKMPACRKIDAGTAGMVEHRAPDRLLVCVRPRGEPDCFWLPASLVTAQ